jgi:hypothetical protein
MVGGPARDFDLTRFDAVARAASWRPARTFFLIGLGFSLLGVLVVAWVWHDAGYPGPVVVSVILAIFVGVGGLFFWVPIVISRPWDAPRTLRVESLGFGLIFKSGRQVRHDWDEEGVAISILEPLCDDSSPPEPTGENLTVVPGLDMCVLTREARQALVEEASRHGLAHLEERYRGILRTNPDRTLTIINRSLARLPFDSVPPTEAWPFPELPLPPGTSPVLSFDLVKGRYRPDAIGIDDPIRAGTLTVETTGFRLARANGAGQLYEFADPKLRISFGRRLESAVTPLDAPRALWHVSFGRTESGLFVSGAARSAVVDSAQSRGLEVRSWRTSVPDRPIWRWIAETRVQAAPGSPAGPV